MSLIDELYRETFQEIFFTQFEKHINYGERINKSLIGIAGKDDYDAIRNEIFEIMDEEINECS